MFLLLLILIFSAAAGAYAQIDDHINVAANRFSQQLNSLKSGTERLHAGNADLTARSSDVKGTVYQLHGHLQKAVDENKSLTRSMQRLQETHPSRTRKIEHLRRELSEYDDKMERVEDLIRISQRAIDAASKEDARLRQRLDEIGMAPPIDDEPPMPDDSEQKEKLRLLKLIDESKEHQQELYYQVAQAKKQKEVTQVVTVQTSGERQQLANQIGALEAQLEQLAKPQPPPEDPWKPEQLVQVQDQIKALQQNHDELQELIGRMHQKAQSIPISQDQRNERNRLRASLEEIHQERRKIKTQLSDLRKQMVSLDKEKASLEK